MCLFPLRTVIDWNYWNWEICVQVLLITSIHVRILLLYTYKYNNYLQNFYTLCGWSNARRLQSDV